jgi:hypothetical protein
VLGGDAADLLMVDTSSAVVSGRNLRFLRIQNATNSQTIVIDRMIITWDNGLDLRRIRIGGLNVWRENGPRPSPYDADLDPNFTLDNVPTNYPINFIRFSGNMSGVTSIKVQFVMTDGSILDVGEVYPASDQFNFRVKSTGKVTGSNIYRTIQADYNANPNSGILFNIHEIDEEIL